METIEQQKKEQKHAIRLLSEQKCPGPPSSTHTRNVEANDALNAPSLASNGMQSNEKRARFALHTQYQWYYQGGMRTSAGSSGKHAGI